MKVRYPERVIYPIVGFTKRDVIEYYRRIAPFLIPHLKNRPVTLKRYPDQAQGEFFYEKDAPAFTPKWVKTYAVWRRSGESQIHYVVINDARTLEWAASVGTLEIHPFLARTGVGDSGFEAPTQVVFDLDPGEGADILRCARVAFLLRDLLQRLELQSFAKVSGSKGLQVYVPLNTAASYAATQPFARSVAEMLEKENPREITAAMEKSQRKSKVFIDWSQNADYKTTVSVYSLRAKRRHPYVSAPVAWEELEQAVDDKDPATLFFLPDAAVERATKQGDLFAPLESLKQVLPEAFAVKGGASKAQAAPRRRPADGSRASEQGGRRTFALVRKDKQFELLLQVHETARAWRMVQVPERAGQRVAATPISPNNFSATVMADSGTVELIEGNVAKGYLDLWFSGNRLNGEYILRSTGQWEFIRPKATERYAPESFLRPGGRGGPTATEPYVRKRRSESPIALANDLPRSEPRFVAPMECKLVNDLPEGPEWMYELKLDGYRIVAVIHGGRADIYSRRGTRFGDRFPAVRKTLGGLALPDCVLDGEIVALDEQGRPSFQMLQNSRSTQPVVYYVFDVLNIGGRDLQRLPIRERKRLLAELAKKFDEPIRLNEVLDAHAKSLVAQVKRLGLEGVVAKRSQSRYEPGKRSGAWVKYRINEREDLIIGGYLPGRTGLDALLVGRKRGGKLYFVKKVRNGFVPHSRERLLTALKPLQIAGCPFVNLPEPSSRRGAVDKEEMPVCVWVRPERQAEIEYAERTTGGRLRHASFRTLIE